MSDDLFNATKYIIIAIQVLRESPCAEDHEELVKVMQDADKCIKKYSKDKETSIEMAVRQAFCDKGNAGTEGPQDVSIHCFTEYYLFALSR